LDDQPPTDPGSEEASTPSPEDKPWDPDAQADQSDDGFDAAQDPEDQQSDPGNLSTLTREQLEARVAVLEWSLRSSEARLAEALKRQDEMVAAYRKMQSEYEGAKVRLDRERVEKLERERCALIEVFFDPMDNLERSIAAAAQAPGDDRLLEGLRLVLRQFQTGLLDLGLERLDPKGQPFSPDFHEALAVRPVEDPAQDGQVLEVWQPGYKIGTRLLRPARVLIGKK
jgi:molecular chaperone GrpE (heat shock protein)